MSGDPVSVLKLVNGSAGDPALYLDFPGQDNAVLFDAGELSALAPVEARDVGIMLLSHHHMDHFVGFDRILRSTIDRKKTVQILGPPGTIERVEKKLGSYVHFDFPFMQVRYEVTELVGSEGSFPRASFACVEGFARKKLAPRKPRKDGIVLETTECRVRWAPASHTTTCVSYAVDIKRGHRFDPEKAKEGVLRPGPWVGRVLDELARPVAKRRKTIRVDEEGGTFPLQSLVKRYFRLEAPRRIGFITDTRDTPDVRPGLVDLVRGSWRLYCDSYYAKAQSKQAEKYGHLTATKAATLARDAGVESLVLMHLGPRYRGRYPSLLQEAREVFPATEADLPQRSNVHDRHTAA